MPLTYGYSAIITKGLGGSACDWITTQFSVFCFEVVVSHGSSSAGGMPMEGGSIHDFYTPVADELQPYVIPPGQEAEYLRKQYHVKIKINGLGREIEKDFIVRERTASQMVKVGKFVNATRDRVKVIAGELKSFFGYVIKMGRINRE